MRSYVAIAFAASCVATATPLAAQPAPAPPEAEATVEGFHAALKRGDTQAALQLLAEDALILEQGHAEQGRAEYAAEHLAADAEFARDVATSTTRRTSGAAGDIAWIATEARLQGRFRGSAVNRVSAETMLLRRTGADWRIVHIHWSSGAHG